MAERVSYHRSLPSDWRIRDVQRPHFGLSSRIELLHRHFTATASPKLRETDPGFGIEMNCRPYYTCSDKSIGNLHQHSSLSWATGCTLTFSACFLSEQVLCFAPLGNTRLESLEKIHHFERQEK
jgi:hypothetical protein